MTTPPAPDDRPPRKREGESLSEWYQMTGVGVEFIAAVGMGLGAGFLLDRWTGWSPWGLLAGGGLGFAVGLWLLMKAAKRMFHD